MNSLNLGGNENVGGETVPLADVVGFGLSGANMTSVMLRAVPLFCPLLADQGSVIDQFDCGFCQRDGSCVLEDLRRSAHYLKLFPDQRTVIG
jgi:hypothetical protein